MVHLRKLEEVGWVSMFHRKRKETIVVFHFHCHSYARRIIETAFNEWQYIIYTWDYRIYRYGKYIIGLSI